MTDDNATTGADERRRLLDELERERNQLLRNIEFCRIRDIDRPFVDRWSLKDIVGHVASWEAEVIVSLQALREGRRPAILDLERSRVDDWNADHVERKRDLDFWSLLQQLRSGRERLLGEIERIPENEFANERSLDIAFLRRLVAHDREHWHEIAARVAGVEGARRPAVSGALPTAENEPEAAAQS